MAEFWINTKKTLKAVESIRNVVAELRSEQRELNSLTVPPLGSATGDIVARLDSCRAELNDEISSLQVWADALEHIVYMYQSTDEKAAAHATSSKNKGTDLTQADNTDLTGNSEKKDLFNIEQSANDFEALLKSLKKNMGPLDFAIWKAKINREQSLFDRTQESLTANDSAMGKLFDFSEEEERLLKEAYERFEWAADYLGWSYEEKIHWYFSITAALIPDYSSQAKHFKYLAMSPSTDQAIKFYDALGLNGKEMQEILMNQHKKNEGQIKRDFAHEYATIAVLSCDGGFKDLAGLSDNVDALAGYKGDVYTDAMDDSDMNSDISAFNYYNRIKKSEDGDIWRIMSEYNEGVVNGTINESLEYLENYGDGDAEKGMAILEEEMYDESIATSYLKDKFGYEGKKLQNHGSLSREFRVRGKMNESDKEIIRAKQKEMEEIRKENEERNTRIKNKAEHFLNYVSENSGIGRKNVYNNR